MSITSTEQSLAHIKELLLAKKDDEAYREIAKCIQLEPDNADYHFWLARLHNFQKNHEASVKAASQAIRLDPSNSMAYVERGSAYMMLENFKQCEADIDSALKYGGDDKRAYAAKGMILGIKEKPQLSIEALTKALESPFNETDIREADIVNAELLLMRSYSYKDLGDYKHAIEDQSRAYEVLDREKTEFNPKFQLWADTTYDHFQNTVLPQIKSAGEKFIDYWESYLSWGIIQTSTSNSTGLAGSYGTGYVCLTEQNIRIISLGNLTRRFPLVKKKGFLRRTVEHAVLGPPGFYDVREPEKEDRIFPISYSSIQGSQVIDKRIELVASTATWLIFTGETEQLQIMNTAINMGISGELTRIWSTPQADESKYTTINVGRDLHMGDSVQVSLGDNAIINGDFSVANSIKDSFNKTDEAAISDELKTLLKEFSIAVGKMSEKMDVEEARRVAQDLEILTTEAINPKPQERRWKFSMEGLKEAAKNVGEIGKPVLDLAVRIASILSIV